MVDIIFWKKSAWNNSGSLNDTNDKRSFIH